MYNVRKWLANNAHHEKDVQNKIDKYLIEFENTKVIESTYTLYPYSLNNLFTWWNTPEPSCSKHD